MISAAQLQGFWFNPELQLLSELCSPNVCVDSMQVLLFPPIFEKVDGELLNSFTARDQ